MTLIALNLITSICRGERGSGSPTMYDGVLYSLYRVLFFDSLHIPDDLHRSFINRSIGSYQYEEEVGGDWQDQHGADRPYSIDRRP